MTKAPLNYVTVINSTPEEDSYVYSSSVPALKSLSREVLPDGGIPNHPISVKVAFFPSVYCLLLTIIFLDVYLDVCSLGQGVALVSVFRKLKLFVMYWPGMVGQYTKNGRSAEKLAEWRKIPPNS